MIRSYAFSQGKIQAKDVPVADMARLLGESGVFLWVDFEKPSAEEARAILEGVFHFHPLSIEDCIQDSPSPKVEEYNPQADDKFTPYLFIVMHAVDYSRAGETFTTSELNLFLGKNFLVTYHDVPFRSVVSVEERCQKGALNIGRAPDRLTHALLDAMVDNYKPALDELSQEIARLEEQALQSPRPKTLTRITSIKKEVLRLRLITDPQTAVLARLSRGEFPLIRPQLLPYFRDVHDSLVHVSAMAQSYADSLTGILQIYLNMSSNQTGEVVKVLTLITVITTPVMMIGTWYGMNFKSMPELDFPHGYLLVGIAAVLSTVATVLYFKKKRWL